MILDHIKRCANGYASHIVKDALDQTGSKIHPDSEMVGRLKDRLAAMIVHAIECGNLAEPSLPIPPALQDAELSDKDMDILLQAAERMAGEPEKAPGVPQDVAEGLDGVEVLETRQPPPARRQRPQK